MPCDCHSAPVLQLHRQQTVLKQGALQPLRAVKANKRGTRWCLEGEQSFMWAQLRPHPCGTDPIHSVHSITSLPWERSRIQKQARRAAPAAPAVACVGLAVRTECTHSRTAVHPGSDTCACRCCCHRCWCPSLRHAGERAACSWLSKPTTKERITYISSVKCIIIRHPNSSQHCVWAGWPCRHPCGTVPLALLPNKSGETS